METAPLTVAHALVRNASHHTHQTALAAVEQHQAAAGEFSKAAEGVEDAEALRILSLLELHHQQLAQIIKSQANHTPGDLRTDATPDTFPVQPPPPTSVQSSEAPISSPPATGSGLERNRSPVDHRRPPRQLSSSIASNLATARGIPRSQQQRARKLSPTTSPQSAKGESVQSRVGYVSPEFPRSIPTSHGAERTIERHTTRTQTMQQTADIDGKERRLIQNTDNIAKKSMHDDRFQKFYSTFEGLLSKISAPLAFAGLPLTADDPSQQKSESTGQGIIQTPTRATTSDSTDINRLFSKAALRAVKDDHGPGFGGVQESFFVVPTSGGSVSYAGILSHAERHMRKLSHESPILPLHDNQTTEEFVDARESPQLGSSPKSTKGSSSVVGQITGGRGYGNKTTEELEMENESLKHLTDTLSKRLYMWEKSAQNQTSALQASIRSLGGQSGAQMPQLEAMGDGRPRGKLMGTGNVARKDTLSGSPKSDTSHTRVAELEEELKTARRELEKYGRENEKLRTVVMRYRERWDKLKEGARVRREGTAGAVQGVEDAGVS